MNIRSAITRAVDSFDNFLIRGPFRRGSGLRITPMEGAGEFDPKLATQTTNLILAGFRMSDRLKREKEAEHVN